MVLRSEAGAPEAEYLLFDGQEIELRATELHTVREVGYRTTVGDAVERLEAAGITAALAREAAAALVPAVSKTYARGAARRATALLGPRELFDGYMYDAPNKTYLGLWLDLSALSADLSIAGAGVILQAFWLATYLEGAAETAEVRLTTLEYMKSRRPGERSIHRVSVKSAELLPEALRMLAPRTTHAVDEQGRSSWDLLEVLRTRGGVPPARLAKLQEALSASEPPPRGPLAEPQVWAIEASLSAGETEGVLDRIDGLERARGRQPVTIYLRCRAALMLGAEAPEAIAERLSQLAMSHSFAELELLAAQAWWAAGKPSRALPFARDILSNPSADEEVRARAELMVSRATAAEHGAEAERIPQAQRRTAPPTAPPSKSTANLRRPSREGYLSGLDLEWEEAKPPGLAPPDRPSPVPAVLMGASVRPPPQWMQGASMPPFRSDFPPPKAIPKGPILPRFEPRPPEAAETLSLPPGLHGQSVGVEVLPRTALKARIQFTMLSRELGRDYRLRSGIELRTDLNGIENMQRGLRDLFPTNTVATQEEAMIVRRHGAFLAELLARSLGAEWSDIAPSELGYWAMIVPPATRVWPFGRVLRFISAGSKERDLVSYYLELVARGRTI